VRKEILLEERYIFLVFLCAGSDIEIEVDGLVVHTKDGILRLSSALSIPGVGFDVFLALEVASLEGNHLFWYILGFFLHTVCHYL